MNIKTLISIFSLLSLVAAAACAENTNFVVVDKYTDSPISGAIVLKATLGKNSDTGQYECLHLQSSVTNASGKLNFATTTPTALLNKYSNLVTSTFAFKQGYRWDMQPTTDSVLRLFQDDLPAEMRLDYLSLMISSSECQNTNNRKNLLLPYFRAIHKEAAALPGTQKSQAALQKIERRIAAAWSPSDNRNPSELDRVFETQVRKLLR